MLHVSHTPHERHRIQNCAPIIAKNVSKFDKTTLASYKTEKRLNKNIITKLRVNSFKHSFTQVLTQSKTSNAVSSSFQPALYR